MSRESAPMSPLPAPPLTPAASPRKALQTNPGETIAERALRKSIANSVAIGEPPDPIAKTPGTGIIGLLVDLTEMVRELKESFDADRAHRAAETKATSEATALRRAPWDRVIWIAIGTAVSAIVGSGLVGLGAWLSKRWTW